MERVAVVAGGGIGGLAVAAGLGARGWRVEVLEKAPAFGEVGAGLSLWPNGMRALDALGLGDQVRVHALHDIQGGIRDLDGRWLSHTDTAAMEQRYGPVVMIHRAEFLEILHRAAPGLRPGTEVTGVDLSGPRVRVEHTGGVTEADLLIGADGIRSTVRRAVWPRSPEPRYAGYTAWRLVVDSGPLAAGGETWGRGERFGISPLPGGRAYLFGVAGLAAGGRSADGELAELRRRFGGWHDPIPRLLDAASPGSVLRHDIYEMPALPSFVSGRVALLGDAAHAMTPNLGQGANQALEDAITLVTVLDAHPDVPAALVAYDHMRRPRTQMISRRSRRIGALAQMRALPALRNLALRLTPSSSLLNALAPVLDWQVPDAGRAY